MSLYLFMPGLPGAVTLSHLFGKVMSVPVEPGDRLLYVTAGRVESCIIKYGIRILLSVMINKDPLKTCPIVSSMNSLMNLVKELFLKKKTKTRRHSTWRFFVVPGFT